MKKLGCLLLGLSAIALAGCNGLDHKEKAAELIGGEGGLPPEYLQIPNWKDCLSTENMGSFSEYCMPTTDKPANCPQASWDKLKEIKMKACS
ncbi:hypothetical protein EDC56_2883 [Sinobacterium caligoides]|uniref:Lipoprotein n=1 Tax=Sinobacterium caligoides TaxID=933926 RepID=A0A3N2DLK9_9GAMM|nr:hypothetical protein [Sinobacterium caligoides]ROS00245.1 hypothetical protein EDC56_2883 [Sinobacterium caligoides]